MRVGSGILTFITLYIFTRILSPVEYGIFALGTAITAVASGVIYQWLSVAVSRYTPSNIFESEKVICVASIGFWSTTLVLAILCLVAIPFLRALGVDAQMVAILFLITVALGRYTLALQLANAEGSPLRYGILSWSKSAVALLVGVVFVKIGVGEHAVLMGLLVGLLFSILFFAPNIFLLPRLRDWDRTLAGNMFRYGAPLTLSNLAIAIVDLADRFLIGRLLGAANVAPYAVAYDLAQQTIGPVMNVLFLAAFPLIVKLFEEKNGDPVLIHTRLHYLGSTLVGVGLPVAVCLGFLADDISQVMFGNEYSQDAAMIMPWIAAAIFVGAFKSYFLDVVFNLKKNSKYLGYIAILMAFLNITLNILLLPAYGVIAAAWATLASFIVGAFISWFVGKSLYALPSIGNDILRSTFATLIMVATLYSISSLHGILGLLIKLVIAFIVYVLIAWKLDIGRIKRLSKL